MENPSIEDGTDFRAIAENSPEAVLVVAGDTGQIVYCNPPAEKLSGFSAVELLSHQFVEFLHPQEQIKLLQNYRQRLGGKAIPQRYETKVVTVDGRIVHVEIRAQKISWDNRPADFITLKDLSDLKWLESFIQSHAEVLETLGECVTITDKAQTILFISNIFLNSTGLRKEDIIGRNNKDFFTGEMRTKLPEIERRVLIDGGTWQGEITVRHPEGRNMQAWVHISPLMNEKGKVVGSISIAVDIQERKQLDNQLQTQIQMLDSLVEGIATDADGIITYVSEQVCQLSGWKREDWLGRHVFETFPPEFRDKGKEILKLMLCGQSFSGEIPVVGPDGSIMHFMMQLKPVVKEGQIVSIIGLTADLKNKPAKGSAALSTAGGGFGLEEQLKTQTQMLDSLIAGVVTDASGIITYVSEQAYQWTGWKREDLLGRQIFETFPAEFHEEGKEKLKLILAGQSYNGEIPIICPDGSIKRFRMLLKPVVKEGRVVSIVGISADLIDKPSKDNPDTSTAAGNTRNDDKPVSDTSGHLQQIQSRVDEVKEQLGKMGQAQPGKSQPLNRTIQAAAHESEEDMKAAKIRLEVYCLGPVLLPIILPICVLRKKTPGIRFLKSPPSSCWGWGWEDWESFG